MNRTQMVPPKTATSVEPNLYNGKASPNAARSIAANHGAPELNMTSPNAAVPIPNKAVPKAAILDTSNAVLYDATASEASNFTIPCAIAPTGLNALAPITVSTVRSDDVRSSKFYYADGGVMVQVQNKLYELDRRTLANVSESFDEAFKSSTNGGWTSWTGSFTRSPVYEVRGIQSQDFERFLETVLRFDHIVELSTCDVYVSLLRAAHALKSKAIFDIAKHRLRILSQIPHPDDPTADEERAIRDLLGLGPAAKEAKAEEVPVKE